MRRLLCLVRFHEWMALKWGSQYPAPVLDARQCTRCERFEVWAYGSFHRANIVNFQPVVPA